MRDLPLSWNEVGLLVPLIGSLWASTVDTTTVARRRAAVAAVLACAAALVSWVEFARSGGPVPGEGFRGMAALGLGGLLAVDELNAPLIPLVSLVSLVTILVTLRSKIRRFSFARILLLEALLMITLSARNPWVLILFLGVTDLPVAAELRARERPVRGLAVHLGAAFLLLAGGWLAVRLSTVPGWTAAGYGMIAAGVGIRSGLVPAHCWVLDLFENASLGTALIATSPLVGTYAAARLLLPGAPPAVLLVLACAALGTALYGAAMSVVQANARRFFCYFFLSHTSLVLAGIMLATPLAVTAALVLWISAPLSLAGFGLTLRALEARTGRLSLSEFQGLHVQTPTLAALFLVTGLAAVGFPGTLGFFGAEMLTDAAARIHKPLAVGVVLSAALSGIAAVRAYGRLFLGARHRATVSLRIRRTERVAFLALVALLLGGTLWSQTEITSRNRAADAILALRGSSGAVDTGVGKP